MDITGELKQLFKRGYDECNKQIAKKESHQEKKGSSKKIESSKAIGGDKIEFSYSVLLNARNTLQELIKMQTYSEIIDSSYSQIQTEMKDVKSKIYYWKSNPENNIKMLRQSFSKSGLMKMQVNQFRHNKQKRQILKEICLESSAIKVGLRNLRSPRLCSWVLSIISSLAIMITSFSSSITGTYYKK